MLIRSVGLFWHADRVYWGAGSQAGKLLGVPRTNVTAEAIDFRDQRGIYVLYAGYEMVYVGQTGSQGLLKRLKQHRHDDLFERWDRFSWFGLRWVKQNLELSSMTAAKHPKTSDTLDHIEAILRSRVAVPSHAANRAQLVWIDPVVAETPVINVKANHFAKD